MMVVIWLLTLSLQLRYQAFTSWSCAYVVPTFKAALLLENSFRLLKEKQYLVGLQGGRVGIVFCKT